MMTSLSGPETELPHASCVAVHGKGVLILGASGQGKSALALDLMSRGADLVADDRVLIKASEDGLVASAPEAIRGMIEARGVGILNATSIGPVTLALVIDLDQTETERLPQCYTFSRAGVELPLLYRVPSPYFVPAILQFLKAGRNA